MNTHVVNPGPGPLFGPDFSSFRADEVAWLLADYTELNLEADIGQREADIQSGRAHYADDLPREATPTAEYMSLFDAALQRNAPAVASAVASAADDLRGRLSTEDIVLVSLARAGVPAGIWLKHRLATTHETRTHHYAISIVRDRGIDLHALAWIAAHHDVGTVVFVDGWSGKGTIRRELTSALREAARIGLGFPDRFVVIADPARVADIAGTTEDLLIPTACLNSTSCGLVSRTVLPRGDASASPYHGARLYSEFSELDRSRAAVDEINARVTAMPNRSGSASRRTPGPLPKTAWEVAERLGISDLNLIKPGFGETTRVLQRRIPWKVLVDPEWMRHPDMAHIHSLAACRGVEVLAADTWPYRCIGVIRPLRPGHAPERTQHLEATDATTTGA